VELAAQFNVSRPILRHALDVLKKEGAVEARRGSGTFVRPSTAASPMVFGPPQTLGDIADCFRFRAVFERGAAEEAARHGSEEDIAAIEAAMLAMERKPLDDNALSDADMGFHMAIAQATGNQYFVMTCQLLRPHILVGLRLARQLRAIAAKSTSRNVEREHRSVFEAIRKRDPVLAGEQMAAHLGAGMERTFGKRAW
jgi:GntR family transcriptional repressor for pyruvate dehydrogenase complex